MTNQKTEMPDVLYVHDHNGLKVTKELVWPETLISIREYTYIRKDLTIPLELGERLKAAAETLLAHPGYSAARHEMKQALAAFENRGKV